MASPGNQEPEDRSSHWLAILRTLIVEILVLLAVAGAAVYYVGWSSDANWAAFVAASQTSGQALPRDRTDARLQAAQGQAPCRRGN